MSVSGRTTDGFDATVEADAQTAFDALFGTRASHAPGSLNVDKDLIDARAEVSRGPWTLRAGYFGQRNLGAGAFSGTAPRILIEPVPDPASPNGLGFISGLDAAFSVRNLLDEDAREPSDSPAGFPFDIPLAGRNFYGELRFRF